MLIYSNLKIPLTEAKDLKIVIPWTFDFIKDKCVNFDSISMRAYLYAMTYKECLVVLSKHLPDEAIRFDISYFEGGKDGLTAIEFRKNLEQNKERSSGCFSGFLTQYLSVQKSMDLILELLKLKSSSLRSTSFSLDFRNLCFKGASGNSRGEISLDDGRTGKRRFQLYAMAVCPGQGIKDKEVKAFFQSVARESGIGFDKGRMEARADDELLKDVSEEMLVQPAVCFREVFKRAKDEVKISGYSWKGLPYLYGRFESFDVRSKSIGMGVKGEVNFLSPLKKYVKELWPDYQFLEICGDDVIFSKKLFDEFDVLLNFERFHHMGLGKAYSISLGVQHTKGLLAGTRWEENLFCLFHEKDRNACFTYSTTEELTASFDSVTALLEQIFPVFYKYVNEYFADVAQAYAGKIEKRGGITAREGFNEAQTLATAWQADAQLRNITNFCILKVRAHMGPAIDENGRIRSYGSWQYCFLSRKMNQFLNVEVPCSGSMKSWTWNVFDHAKIEKNFSRPVDRWPVDSNQVIRKVEESGGAEARQLARKCFGVSIQLGYPRDFVFDHALWRVEYLLMNDRNVRDDKEYVVDAITGELLNLGPRLHMHP